MADHPAQPPTEIEAELSALRARVALLEQELAQSKLSRAEDRAGAQVEHNNLRDAERKYRLLIEHIPALTYISALDENSTTLYISPQVKHFFGISPEEWMIDPTRWERMVHPEDLERAIADLRRAQATDSRVTSEYRVIARDGRVTWLRDESIMVRDKQGNPEFLQGVVIDITDLRQAEEDRLQLERQLFHAQKLESLGVLAGGIAHDFNNLLTAILGNASLALMDLPAGSEITPYLQRIKQATQQAAGLTQQMLAYAGKGRFMVQTVNINAVILELGELLKASISRSAELRYALANNLSLIEADISQIRQVILNLIVNGAEAIGDVGGIVTVTTWVEDGLENGNGSGSQQMVVLQVDDTGTGMDEDTKSKIFDPFFTTKFTGRGLGLSAVQGIVRGHHGTLDVRSAAGYGTTFTVRFPALPVKAALPESLQPVSSPTPTNPANILVIDDEHEVRQVISRVLGRAGYTVMVAESGPVGLELFRRHQDTISCVIVDFTMPRMSGKEVCEAVRAVHSTVPLVLMSGYSEHEIRSQLNTFDGMYLQKPFGTLELRDTVADILAKRSRLLPVDGRIEVA
jgi:PAS domain S-box-containing protein